MKKDKTEKEKGFLSDLFVEVTGSVLFDIALNIIIFIPRMVIRLILAIW